MRKSSALKKWIVKHLLLTIVPLGGFPMEIKTKKRYHIICGYNIILTTNYKISYFNIDFDRKSTYCFERKDLTIEIWCITTHLMINIDNVDCLCKWWINKLEIVSWMTGPTIIIFKRSMLADVIYWKKEKEGVYSNQKN